MAKRKLSAFERLQRGERLSRQERRVVVPQRLNLDDPGLDIIHRDAAGLDVGNESHFVSVPPDRDPQPIREFEVHRSFYRRGIVGNATSN